MSSKKKLYIKFMAKISVVGALGFLNSNCASPNSYGGGGIGMATGALVGGLIGEQSGQAAELAILGGLLGGATGFGVGGQIDRVRDRNIRSHQMRNYQYQRQMRNSAQYPPQYDSGSILQNVGG